MFLEVTREDVEGYKKDCLADRANREYKSITCFCAVARAATRKFGKPAVVGLRAIYLRGKKNELSYNLPAGFYDSHTRIFDAYACAETPDGKACPETQKLAKRLAGIQFPVRVELTKS